MPVVDDPRSIRPEDENARIWRYMDFTKFVSLLDRGALFFAPLDQLGDPFEGSFLPAGILKEGSKVANLDGTKRQLRSIVLRIAVNCWHANDVESAALWRLYPKSDEGIAIQSTYKRLRQALAASPHDIRVGEVRYLDYERETFQGDWELDIFNASMHKRQSFAHERELRAVVWPVPNGNGPNGLYVQVDLAALIEGVYVGPESPAWVTGLVASVSKRYGLVAPVHRSRLLEPPPY